MRCFCWDETETCPSLIDLALFSPYLDPHRWCMGHGRFRPPSAQQRSRDRWNRPVPWPAHAWRPSVRGWNRHRPQGMGTLETSDPRSQDLELPNKDRWQGARRQEFDLPIHVSSRSLCPEGTVPTTSQRFTVCSVHCEAGHDPTRRHSERVHVTWEQHFRAGSTFDMCRNWCSSALRTLRGIHPSSRVS
jgi:hypothetical protein